MLQPAALGKNRSGLPWTSQKWRSLAPRAGLLVSLLVFDKLRIPRLKFRDITNSEIPGQWSVDSSSCCTRWISFNRFYSNPHASRQTYNLPYQIGCVLHAGDIITDQESSYY